MTTIDINGLLAQMRSLSAQLDTSPTAAAPTPGAGKAADTFGNVLQQTIHGVADLQNHADQMTAAFERGDPNTNLPQVMLAVEKAQLSFQAVTQVRNKLVSAYTDIMNMPM